MPSKNEKTDICKKYLVNGRILQERWLLLTFYCCGWLFGSRVLTPGLWGAEHMSISRGGIGGCSLAWAEASGEETLGWQLGLGAWVSGEGGNRDGTGWGYRVTFDGWWHWTLGWPSPGGWGLDCSLSSTSLGEWGELGGSPPLHPRPRAVNGSWGLVSTNLRDTAARLFALPRTKPSGPDPEVLCYSAEEFLSSPASIHKGEIKPRAICSCGPEPAPQVSFLGSCSSRSGHNLQEKNSPGRIIISVWEN